MSKTDPTLVFNSDQIVRTEDAHADEPRIRNLLLNMIVKERSQHKNLKSSNAVMNDVSIEQSTAALINSLSIGLC